jgi:hypothetical protein
MSANAIPTLKVNKQCSLLQQKGGDIKPSDNKARLQAQAQQLQAIRQNTQVGGRRCRASAE